MGEKKGGLGIPGMVRRCSMGGKSRVRREWTLCCAGSYFGLGRGPVLLNIREAPLESLPYVSVYVAGLTGRRIGLKSMKYCHHRLYSMRPGPLLYDILRLLREDISTAP